MRSTLSQLEDANHQRHQRDYPYVASLNIGDSHDFVGIYCTTSDGMTCCICATSADNGRQ